MQNIEIMLSDGILGTKGILLALSTLTTGNLNAKLKKEAKPFTIKQVLPSTHEYIIPPLSAEEQQVETNKNLMAFMAMAPNAPAKIAQEML